MKHDRRTCPVALFVTILFFASNVYAFGLKDIGGQIPGIKEDKQEVDIDTIATQMEESIFAGTKMYGGSVVETAEAVGKRELALKIQAVVDDIEQNKEKYKGDSDALKKKYDEINQGASQLKDIDMEKKAIREESGKHVSKGLLYSGAGMFFNKKAAEYAQRLMDVLPDEIKAKPFEAGKLKDVLSLAKMEATEAPNRMNSMKDIYATLSKYATSHKIPLPTPAEKKAIVEKYAKSVPVDENDL